MGISLLSCYHGAQIFEAYGLSREVIDTAFAGSVSRIGGMSLADLQREAESFWAKVSFTTQHHTDNTNKTFAGLEPALGSSLASCYSVMGVSH